MIRRQNADLPPANLPNPNPNVPKGNPPANGRPEPVPPAPPAAVTGDAKLDQLLADLASKQPGVARQAATQLAGTEPKEHRAAVAAKLAEQVQQADGFARTPLVKALGVWATANEVPALIALLSDKDINTRNEILKVIGKLKDERAAAPVARCLQNLATESNAERALKEMGPVAEKEVLALLTQPGGGGRQAAIRVLRDIGTQQSVPTLQAASQDFFLQGQAREALAAIAARTKP
jgi:HEAT repeat protein